MSGLDSIAMAVALLEQRQCQPPPPLPTAGVLRMPARAPMAKVVSSEHSLETMNNMNESETNTAICRAETTAPVYPPPASHSSLTHAATLELFDQDYLFRYIFSLDLGELATVPVPGPQEDIAFPAENDILCGRGGETNNHRGNVKYRQYVKSCQAAYIECKRRDKPFIAQRIVLAVRKKGGRFLKKDKDSGAWRDVGNSKAREKTSQALREGAPDLRDNSDSVEGPIKASKASTKRAAENKRSAGIVHHYPTLVLSSSSPVSPSKRQCTSMQMPAYRCCPLPPSNNVTFHHAAIVPHLIASVSSNEQESEASSLGSDAAPYMLEVPHKGPRIKLLKKRLEGQIV
ncbi:hypothetical protein MPSEU_000810400 [Mayamaea pseudoterrestris]|nr:hypothetical protein MPSEU_000810400 [Mayamaea pseudoterrestris]